MKIDMERMISLLETGAFSEGYSECEKIIESFEKGFMEELTVETATDFVASVVLFCQFAKAERKPWKAIPQLERIRGALRFMDDFLADRETVSSTFDTVAQSWAYAGLFRDAADYYWKAAVLTENDANKEDLFFQALFFQIRSGLELNQDKIHHLEQIYGKKKSSDLIHEAEQASNEQIQCDPIEKTDEFYTLIYEIEREADRLLSERPSTNEPFCIQYWAAKQQVLKEKFQMEWKSPAHWNPNVQFQ